MMQSVDRRKLFLLSLLAGPVRAEPAPQPTPNHDMRNMPASWTQPDEIAMLVYPQMTALDLIGPQYMFASLMGAKVHLVAKRRELVMCDTGVGIMPTKTFDDCPKDLTVLFAPGGTAGTLAAMSDPETRAFMADRGARARYVTSVCTGSLILGAAGLLRGYRATSHWAARDSLAEFGALPTEARVVRDRNRITGAGVTAGLDFGLTVVAELRGPDYAQNLQLLCEYDPHPPFNAGSLETAPKSVQLTMRQMLSGFPARIHAVAQSLKSQNGVRSPWIAPFP